jgi:hypothetical protein
MRLVVLLRCIFIIYTLIRVGSQGAASLNLFMQGDMKTTRDLKMDPWWLWKVSGQKIISS